MPRPEHLDAPSRDPVLRRALDRFLDRTDVAPLVARDPVMLVRRYADPHDQEVAGLVVAALAYGRASSIQGRAGAALAPLGSRPAAGAADPGARDALEGFVYRFQRGSDLPRFVAAIARVRSEAGSLAAAFAASVAEGDGDYADALDRFSLRLRAAVDGPLTRGLAFLMPRAGQTGAAKRMCLYLRWMVRPAGPVDLGAWRALAPELDPARLVIPLDTHIQRISRYIGLTDRHTPGLATARDITAHLRRLRPADPLAYDLALCHLGISGSCPRRRDPVACEGCPIRGICRLGRAPPRWRRSAV
jgi:uncharacterized protein (TIGR02757 family)